MSASGVPVRLSITAVIGVFNSADSGANMKFAVCYLSRLLYLSLFSLALSGLAQASLDDVLASIHPSVTAFTAQFEQIPAERQKELKKAAAFIRSKIQAGEAAQLTFICTHNSRRSHLAQIWTDTAAA
jgi:hypothetical protein